jgi:hypothetical protein
MELKDLVGEHSLSGVEFGKGPRDPYDYEDPNTMTFVLDGVAYRVTEDPSDSYHSSMRDIEIVDATVSNTFAPVKVVGRHRTSSKYSGEDDVLELIDAANGEVILEVGTSNLDDYYPCYEAGFYPDRMAVNANKPVEPR